MCKAYAEYRICLIMAPNTLTMVEYASVYLNTTEYCWMSLIMPENARINGSNYARALNTPRNFYNNINQTDENLI